ncbi:MAG: hypothetical protein M3Q70_00285 [bacterium]|nr:hypothetical protein [bacterium]
MKLWVGRKQKLVTGDQAAKELNGVPDSNSKKNNMTLSKKNVAILLFLVLVIGTTVAFIYKKNNEQKQTGTEQNAYQPDEVSAPTDYYAPSIEEIRKTNQNPADQYAAFLQYAFGKEQTERYDEAFTYYEAAAEVAPDEITKKNTQYTIYILAQKLKDQEKTSLYHDILGEEYINTKNNSYRREE